MKPDPFVANSEYAFRREFNFPGEMEEVDAFGAGLMAIDTNGDGFDEVLIHSSEDDLGENTGGLFWWNPVNNQMESYRTTDFVPSSDIDDKIAAGIAQATIDDEPVRLVGA